MYKELKRAGITIISLFIMALVLVACSSSPSAPTSTLTMTTGALSFKNDILPIFNASCVVCHQSGKSPAGLSLEPNMAFQNLVNTPSAQSALMRVVPGAPEKSYLINKLQGTQAQAGGSGALMPYNAPRLPDSQINLIQQWIKAGASND